MKSTHADHFEKVRKRVVELATGMLDGTINYLEGSIELACLRADATDDDFDSDFLPFVVISSETDHLPIGAPRQYWSKEALARHELDIQRSTQWAKEISFSACQKLVQRFSA